MRDAPPDTGPKPGPSNIEAGDGSRQRNRYGRTSLAPPESDHYHNLQVSCFSTEQGLEVAGPQILAISPVSPYPTGVRAFLRFT